MAIPRPLPFDVSGKVYLSPMAGLTDLPFRSVAKSFGADVMLTEFTSARALLLGHVAKQEARIRFTDAERPIGVQIFGAVPEEMGAAAVRVEREHAPDFVDINFGCPARKIVDKNGGSGCLRDPALVGEITAAVHEATTLPVTAKIRIGWDDTGGEAATLEVVRRIEEAGASAIAVHGRTRRQGYSGRANWGRIAAVKRAASVPVIGNGDVFGPVEAARMLETTGVDAVMIGRGAIGNPWVFRRVHHYLATGELLPEPTLAERTEVLLRHLAFALTDGGEEARSIREMRRHMAAYTKGLPGAARLRAVLFRLETRAEVEAVLGDFASAAVAAA